MDSAQRIAAIRQNLEAAREHAFALIGDAQAYGNAGKTLRAHARALWADLDEVLAKALAATHDARETAQVRLEENALLRAQSIGGVR